MDGIKNPAELLLQLACDVYGIENVDVTAFMDAIAKMEAPATCDFCGSDQLLDVTGLEDRCVRVLCLNCSIQFFIT